MGNWAYLSRDKLKAELGDVATADDATYRRILEGVSLQMDNWMGRTFRTHLATRYYTPVSKTVLLLDAGLLAVTTLKADQDGNRTYEETWAATDYDLEPYNALTDLKPYTRISLTPNTTKGWPLNVPKGVELVGKWGWHEDLETLAALTAEALDATETEVDVDNGGEFDVLDTLLVDSEQLYVTAIGVNKVTVVRGANGTTAATHTTAATIKRYRYPETVARACQLQAARYFLRKNAPFGVVGSAEVGFIRLRPGLDPDVMSLLDEYKELDFA